MKIACLGVLLFSALFGLSQCGTVATTDVEETAQQVGDAMAAIDESGGSGGTIADLELNEKTLRRLSPANFLESIQDKLISDSYAATCALSSTFGTCSANTITRTFGGCTIGSATLTGTVTLTWGGASSSCVMAAASDYITRSPSFSLTGRRGATLTSVKTGTFGQKITWSSGSGASTVFSFTNDGIRRLFTATSGAITYDFTTTTTSAITITGTSRASRTLSGGGLRVTNNLTSVICDYVPTNVAWSATCSCPSSGSWAGSCTDGKTTTITMTGCGTATYTLGSDTQSVSFDRCYGI